MAETAVADKPADGAPAKRFSPDEVLAELLAVPEDKLSFSSACFKTSLQAQKEIIMRMKAAQEAGAATTLTDLSTIVSLFLKNMYNLASALPGSLQFDGLEDLMARSGLLMPFITGMRKTEHSIVLEMGIPSEERLCDTHEELIRIAATGVVTFYHYTNYPASPDMFPSDDATLLFTTLALKSCTHQATAEAMDEQLAAAGGIVTVAQIRWLMHYIRAQLSGLSGAVYFHMGDRQRHQQQLAAQQADFLGLIKAAPGNPAGYPYYVRTCLQFQQLSAASLFAAKGAAVAVKAGAAFYRAQLQAQRAIALAYAGGGTSSTGGGSAAAAGTVGDVSAAAKAAAAKISGSAPDPAAGPVISLVRAGEIRSLVEGAREGAEAERTTLPEVYQTLANLDLIDVKIMAEKLDSMIKGVPDQGEVPALIDQLYPTRAPDALPRGALTVGGGEGEGEEEGGAEGAAEGLAAVSLKD
ncbi:hypothetical protein HYH03_001888 [Edaphochlamys debaryana]|uniref:Uncharacterized protein n=1 Tax=Edaphochlamys debaryana TaxID=47281 RepID=A0A835YCA7_9CHLO|nr:hypothetical protein HYH03_001888 [Edaphochlamys debaryana]|eukprot:KAG2500312.1 hypothetical protein HYH03_001888 [Edaphochlamys debaryana]